MRVRALILIIVLGSFIGGHEVLADKVKTNQVTKVRAKPGEQEKVLLTLKSGQTMTILSKDGRWLKVRVQGRTGYVPRSTVDMPDDDEIVRNTRRRPFVDGRSTKRGFGGEQGPDDRVGADATGEGTDDSDSGSAKSASGSKASTSKAKPASDDDDDDSTPPAKTKPATKVAAKASSKSAAKTTAKPTDDDDDDADSTPPAKTKPATKVAVKATASSKAAAKPAADDDDDDSTPPKSKAAAKVAAASKPAAKKSSDDDDDDDSSKGKPAAKASDDDSGDETTKVADDSASDDSGGKDKRATAHVGAKVVAYNEHDEASGEAFTAKPNEVLYPGETQGKWTFVETDDGDAGWMLSTQLDLDGGDVAGGPRRRVIGLDANVGVTFLQQAMNTVGSTLTGPTKYPDIYTIGTSAFAVGVGGEVLYPYGKSALLGGEGTYEYGLSYPGIYVPPMNGSMAVNEGVSFDNINLRAIAGYDLHKDNGLALFARLGYRYQAFLVDGNAPNFNAEKNPAKLPSEVTSGPTIGAAVAIPRLTNKIGLNFALDAMLFGASVKQTTDLDDGLTPTAKLYAVDAQVVYRWKPAMDFQAGYILGIGSYDFGMPDPNSLRVHTGTDVKRTDIYNTVTFGLAKGF